MTKAADHKAFSRTEGENGLQFSLEVEILPSNNLKIGSLFGAVSIATATMHGSGELFQTSENHLVSSDEVLR